MPTLPAAGTELVSRVENGLDLHLTVCERFRYTSELLLTYHFQRQDEIKIEPNLLVRIYHDARQAEVMTAELRHWLAFDAAQEAGLEARWRVNRFLFKWLNYCLHQGHKFNLPATANPTQDSPTPAMTASPKSRSTTYLDSDAAD